MKINNRILLALITFGMAGLVGCSVCQDTPANVSKKKDATDKPETTQMATTGKDMAPTKEKPAVVTAPPVNVPAVAVPPVVVPVVNAPVVAVPASKDAKMPVQREQTRQEKLKRREVLREQLWQQRSDAIAKARGQKPADANSTSTTDPSPALQSDSPANKDAQAASADTQKKLNYNEMDKARIEIRDRMKKERLAAIAQAGGNPAAADVANLTTSQRQAVESLIADADGISRALAADDLDKFNKIAARIPATLELLKKEFAPPSRWANLVQGLTSPGEGKPVKDLSEARARFLPYSTVVAELAKRLRKN